MKTHIKSLNLFIAIIIFPEVINILEGEGLLGSK